ncbi:MAG: transcriptional repressor [Bacteroidetes bacterium]|nr:transcriptional repressor [Bacteroidota bacterium]
MLDEIYSRNDHFDAEKLFRYLLKKKFRVSRATVYNTLELLVESALLRKHKFGDQQSYYEKSLLFRQHDHLICNDCGHVFEFCDPRIEQVQKMAGEMLNFTITDHTLNLYGKCNILSHKGVCKYHKL